MSIASIAAILKGAFKFATWDSSGSSLVKPDGSLASPSGGFTTVAISGTKNGVNTTFTIPNGTVSTCIPIWNGATLTSPDDFTRVGATLTLVQAPAALDALWAIVDESSGSTVTASLTSTRVATADDNSKVLVNSSASNYSLTINTGMGVDFGLALAQTSTGTCTLVAGGGVTFIGASTATISAGDTLTLLYVGTNTYIVKRG